MRTILVVEDSEAIRAIYRRMFGSLPGVRLAEARNGREALDYVESGAEVAVILLDLHMPVMDGFECFDTLRARGARCPPIIVVATEAGSQVVQQRLEGAVAFIEKPFDSAELKAAVLAILVSEARGDH